MEINRTGEDGNIPARKSRFFQHEQRWFFTTRECSIIGPYDSFHDAYLGCRKFISQIKAISDFHANEQLYA